MPIHLIKGECKHLDIKTFTLGISSQNDYYDYDLEAFLLGKNKKIVSNDYLVFYNSEKRAKCRDLSVIAVPSEFSNQYDYLNSSRPADPELSVIGPFYSEVPYDIEDDEVMDINLDKVNPEVQEIIITISIYDYINRKQNFGQVERVYVRLYQQGNDAEGKEDYRYDLTEDYSSCKSIELCRIYRFNGEWKIQALGIGHKGGLEELIEKFT